MICILSRHAWMGASLALRRGPPCHVMDTATHERGIRILPETHIMMRLLPCNAWKEASLALRRGPPCHVMITATLERLGYYQELLSMLGPGSYLTVLDGRPTAGALWLLHEHVGGNIH